MTPIDALFAFESAPAIMPAAPNMVFKSPIRSTTILPANASC